MFSYLNKILVPDDDIRPQHAVYVIQSVLSRTQGVNAALSFSAEIMRNIK